MKKILIIILVILLGAVAYYAMFEGLDLLNINILSVKQIADNNEELTQEIEKTSDLINTEYPKKVTEMRKSVQELLNQKQEYLDLANLSSDSEIKEANQSQTYAIEYLWTRIGNHATAEGVNLKLEFSRRKYRFSSS